MDESDGTNSDVTEEKSAKKTRKTAKKKTAREQTTKNESKTTEKPEATVQPAQPSGGGDFWKVLALILGVLLVVGVLTNGFRDFCVNPPCGW